ncbi:MAG: hypothetical protein AB7G06_06460 [Bdellovibrionales bacterium]
MLTNEKAEQAFIDIATKMTLPAMQQRRAHSNVRLEVGIAGQDSDGGAGILPSDAVRDMITARVAQYKAADTAEEDDCRISLTKHHYDKATRKHTGTTLMFSLVKQDGELVLQASLITIYARIYMPGEQLPIDAAPPPADIEALYERIANKDFGDNVTAFQPKPNANAQLEKLGFQPHVMEQPTICREDFDFLDITYAGPEAAEARQWLQAAQAFAGGESHSRVFPSRLFRSHDVTADAKAGARDEPTPQ